MGGIGIWCMHFIGNRATVLADGIKQRQIVYSAGFTALSFFLPILVLLLAFYFLGITERANRLYVILAGILTGTAVCGMHYVGQLGITNYHCNYRIGNVVGAAIIAVVASLVALSVFFRLRETWTDSWWKRVLCASVLGGAVSGMHWTAAVGTQYYFKGDREDVNSHSRVQTVIVAAVLVSHCHYESFLFADMMKAVATCMLLLGIVLVRGRKAQIIKSRAQQVVLACAYFDEEGRVMVTPEGALPCQKITDHFIEKTFGEDELSRYHPTFAWIFKASRNWPALRDLVPGMKANLEADPATHRYRPGNSIAASLLDDASEISVNFAIIFKQLFCVSAQELANTMHEPLEKLGVLFEEPVETGMMNIKHQHMLRRSSVVADHPDLEKDLNRYFFGKGKYLFLNRRLNKSESAKFAAQGYRFGNVSQIAEVVAKSMQISQASVTTRFERMRLCSSPEYLPPNGVHLACFVVRPTIHKSFDVLVPTMAQNQLPLRTLPFPRLEHWQISLLQGFNDCMVGDMLEALATEAGDFEMEKQFRWHMKKALTDLVDLVGDSEALLQAKFSSKLIQAPCRVPSGTAGPSTCTLLSVRLMSTIHAYAARPEMTYVPLSFFSVQQLEESGHTNHEAFARRVKMEFGYCIEDHSAGLRIPSVSHSEGQYAQSRQSSRRTSLADLRFHGPDTTNPSSMFRITKHIRSSRRSDETRIISSEKDLSGDEDMHTIVAYPMCSEFSKDAPKGDVIEMVAHEDKGTFVSELFSMLRL